MASSGSKPSYIAVVLERLALFTLNFGFSIGINICYRINHKNLVFCSIKIKQKEKGSLLQMVQRLVIMVHPGRNGKYFILQ